MSHGIYRIAFIAEGDTHSLYSWHALFATEMRYRYDPFQDIRRKLWYGDIHRETALGMSSYAVFLIWTRFGSLVDMSDHIRSALVFCSQACWVVDCISGRAWDQCGDVGVERHSCSAVAFGPVLCAGVRFSRLPSCPSFLETLVNASRSRKHCAGVKLTIHKLKGRALCSKRRRRKCCKKSK